MSKKTRRLATLAVAGVAAAAILGSATVASAFPNKTSSCTACHASNTGVVVTATQKSNDGVNATYSITVSNPWNDGVTGWAVFDGTANIRNGYGPGTVTIPVGKSYRFWGAAGSGGNGSNYITVSPVAPPPPPPADTTAPTVAITSPANGATVSGNVALAANATDASGIARVDFKVDGVTVGTDAVAPYTGVWNATAASVGSHKIEAVAVDTVGLSAVTSISVSIAPPPPPADTTAPTVAITSPANGATVSGIVALAANAADASGIARVDFKVDGVLVGFDATAPYTSSWDTAIAAPGTHLIEAVAYDAVGLSTSTSIQVSIASPPPPPPAVTTSDMTISVVNGAGAPVSGAKIIVKNSVTGTRYVRLASAAGTTTLLDLPYGAYSISVSGRGYSRTGARVTVDAPTEQVSLRLTSRK